MLDNQNSKLNHKKDFEWFWREAIFPAIEYCLKDADINFINGCGLEKKDIKEYKKQLEQIYKRKREWLKKNYLPHQKNPMLDFHKLGAIVCRSIIGLKPFNYDLKLAEQHFSRVKSNLRLSHKEIIEWEIRNIYINYRVAFLSSIGIVYADLIYWGLDKYSNCDDENDLVSLEAFYKTLLNNNNLVFYKEPENHENFVNSIIIALMKDDLLGRDFDYLQYSAILYQIQEYTKLTVFCELLNDYTAVQRLYTNLPKYKKENN